MAGLALGSSLGGWASRWPGNPVIVFGLIELATGLYGAFSPAILSQVGGEYVHLAGALGLSPIQQFWMRSASAGAALLFPTTLMGMTFPLVLAAGLTTPGEAGLRSGLLYAANLLGAAFGTLLVGFVLVPQLGIVAAIRWAAAINFASGLMVLASSRRFRRTPRPREMATAPTTGAFSMKPPLFAVVAAGFFVSGFCTLAYEQLWTRWLVLLLGANSVYVFTIVLACFLLGMYSGSRRAARIVDTLQNPVGALGGLLVLVGAAALGVAVVVGLLAKATSMLTLAHPTKRALVGCLGLALFILLPLLTGTSVSIIGRILANRFEAFPSLFGELNAVNTTGCLAGAFITGFVVLPRAGLQRGMVIVSGIAVAVGLWVLRRSAASWLSTRRACLILTAAGVVGALALSLPPPILFRLDPGRQQLLFYKETANSSVAVVEDVPDGSRSLWVDGDFQSGSDRRHQTHLLFLGHLPSLLSVRRDTALVVGLGGGFTLGAVLRHPFGRVDLVELSKPVVEASGCFSRWTGHPVARDPRVALRIDDGRNFLLTTHGTWDVITTDPVDPDDAGATILYSTEYYKLVRARLRPGGVAAQWLSPHLRFRDYQLLLRSFSSVFPVSFLWDAGYTTVAIGFADAPKISEQEFRERLARAPVQVNLASIGVNSSADLLNYLIAGPAELREIVGSGPLNTDDHPRIEYSWLVSHTPGSWKTRIEQPLRARHEEVVRQLLPDGIRDPIGGAHPK
ncbi:MAG TPA: fused MFS/spermidine synthase [Verrucomicrobiae bacterium]|nr:fused MFS/spermidine synthase [Verrucomicrobiae bacterium]